MDFGYEATALMGSACTSHTILDAVDVVPKAASTRARTERAADFIVAMRFADIRVIAREVRPAHACGTMAVVGDAQTHAPYYQAEDSSSRV